MGSAQLLEYKITLTLNKNTNKPNQILRPKINIQSTPKLNKIKIK